METEWFLLSPEAKRLVYESIVTGLALRLMQVLPDEKVIRELDRFTDWLKNEVDFVYSVG